MNLYYLILYFIMMLIIFTLRRRIIRDKDFKNIKIVDSTYPEFSFGGCSWGCLYYIGCIKAIYELNLDRECKVICCSSGCLMGIALLLKTDIETLINIYQELTNDCLKYNSPMGRMTKWYKRAFERLIPNDEVAKSLSKNLTIVYTKFPSMEYIRKNNFKDKNDLMKSCLASSFIPFYFTEMVFDKNQLCLDGGFINNYPKLSSKTISIGVVKSNSNKKYPDIYNSNPVKVFGPTDSQDQEKVIQDGYNSTISYFN